MSGTAPGSGGGSPGGWKALLALISLGICALLWISGLQQSLQRPSVQDALVLRQQELAVQAEVLLPQTLRSALGAEGAQEALARELRKGLAAKSGPPRPDLALELALLEGKTVRVDRLQRLVAEVPPEQRALLQALLEPPAAEADRPRINLLLAPWPVSPLTRQLVCRQLAATPGLCVDPATDRSALGRWLAVTVGPLLLVVLGSALLLRQLWRRWRGSAPALPPLLGPALSLVDATLLIAGGFVVLGELVVPQLLIPLVQHLLVPLESRSALAEALQVLLLYSGLMVVPLLILRHLLRPLPRDQRSLQWRWRPLGPAFWIAVQHVLMVLPAVALSGWVLERFWTNQSGSNPLLEVVLNTGDPLALGALVTTAVVLAPLFEEMLFRGVLLPVVGKHWGAGWGVGVSALTFGLAHLSLGELTPLFVLGLALGWLRLSSGRLAPCVLMHSLWNGLTFVNLLLLA
ncbi:MAG: type II CAAX endopeptidase family protein [Cyanobacteriota bacterium]|jgi:membrane protease YdiL (CAAX protease family)|nr:type II CAAX endopeptidase family protein [Cyanobacteriota bacterium]